MLKTTNTERALTIFLPLASLLLFACTSTTTEPSGITHEEAYVLALTACQESGTVHDEGVRNENTKTWWFDLDTERPGCNPACVVHDDGSAEINWRCTGLIEPDTPAKTELANPSATFCVEQGYTYEIRNEADGQNGYCIFSDGSSCEGWTYYRGECGPGSMGSACETDADCFLPFEYAARSSCPYQARCTGGSCEVICPWD
ncbi:MAG: DUF333 domain-containing protein [Nitrosarchaeum sp.]|nr:DUF333 domain-containing protein [Nitrosarchaeum sp.]